MNTNKILMEAVELYAKEYSKLHEEVNSIMNVVPFLKERSQYTDKQSLGLMLELFGFGKDKDKRTIVSNEEKELVSAIKTASAKSKELRSVDMSNLESLKEKLDSFVHAILDVHEKEVQLDPSEVSPEMKNNIDMLFGMGAYVLGKARAEIWDKLNKLNHVLPSSRMKAAVQKYMQNADQTDMQSMVNKINVPLAKRIGGMFKAGLDQGGDVGKGVGGTRG